MENISGKLIVASVVIGLLVIFEWATQPAQGTKAFHEQTLKMAAKCRGYRSDKEVDDCVKDKAGRDIALDDYVNKPRPAPKISKYVPDELPEDAKKAMAKFETSWDADRAQLEIRARALCNRNLGITLRAINALELLTAGYSSQKADDWSECMVHTMHPVTHR
jgi:hypothetical protein